MKEGPSAAADGPSFINVLSTCPPGWGYDTRDTVRVARLAVECRYWPLFEVVEGHYRMTHEPAHPRPLQEWLDMQKRFAHLRGGRNPELIAELQRELDRQWEMLKRRTAEDAAWFAARETESA